MKIIIKIIIVFLIIYFIYAFVFSLVISAFNKNSFVKKPDNNKVRFSANNNFNKDRVQLIESEKEAVKIRKTLIDNAKQTISISYFTFRNGKVSRLMLGSILEAAEKGVEVRILLDSLSILPSFLPRFNTEFKYILYAMERHKNINFKFYDPVNPLFPFNWNKRLHDKMIIVDNKFALIGGRNIADNYYIKDLKNKSFSKDRDVLVFKEDSLDYSYSVIEDMQNYFNKSWNYKYSKSFRKKLNKREENKSNIALKKLENEYENSKKLCEHTSNNICWQSYTIACDNIEFVHNPVGKIHQEPWCLRKILSLAEKSSKSIFLQSPYIIPSRRLKTVFNEYNINLKNTRVLTNSNYSSPNHLSIAAYSNHRKNMLDNNVGIFEYQGKGSLHGKTYIFDDYISAIGSFNMDSRSSFINSEILIVISGSEFTNKLKKCVQKDLDQSLKVGKSYSYITSPYIDKAVLPAYKKVIIKILSKITPIIEHIL